MNADRLQSPDGAGLLSQVPGLDALVAAVRPSDALFAVGSVANGLAGPGSVLDLLLVGPGSRVSGMAASAATARSATYSLPAEASVRIRFCTDDELHELSSITARFDEAFYEPAIFANLPHLDIGAQVLLHELRTGIVLANSSIAHAWRAELRLEHLPRYLAAVRLLRYAARRRNVMAHLRDGDTETAQWTFREAVEELLACGLATVGETNPRKRWHLRLLRHHCTTLGGDVEGVIGLAQCWSESDGPAHVHLGVARADAFAAHLVATHPELALFAPPAVTDRTSDLDPADMPEHAVVAATA